MSNSSDYPPQQPQPPYPGYTQPQQPQKKKKTGLIIGIIIGALVLCGICGGIGSVMSHSGNSTTTTATTTSNSNTSSTSTPTKPPTTTPTKPLSWQTVKTLKGTGTEKTDTFTVPDTWKLTWSCDPASFQNIQYNVIAIVEDSSGAMVDSGVNALCKAGSTSGETNVTSGGTVRLDITSEGDWTFNIQVQK